MKCLQCQEEFEPKVKFCSPRCRVHFHRGGKSKKNAGISKPSGITDQMAGEVPMDKTEKIEALRNLISMTEKKHEDAEPEGRGCNTCVYWEKVGWTCIAPGCSNWVDPNEPVLYDDSKDIPEEYKLKPGYGPRK